MTKEQFVMCLITRHSINTNIFAASITGNHDLDFGLEEFRELRDKCNFPWLCSNAVDADDEEPLGGEFILQYTYVESAVTVCLSCNVAQMIGCHEYIVLDKSQEGGPKVLIVGLVEQAWMVRRARRCFLLYVAT